MGAGGKRLHPAMKDMRILITKPAPQAQVWAEKMQQLGWNAHALPLVQLHALADTSAITTQWHQLEHYRLVCFVSPNAVHHFFALKPLYLHWPAQTQAGSTGPGTSVALREYGLSTHQIIEPPSEGAQFDSEALWNELKTQDWTRTQVLWVRAHSGRNWLVHQLRNQGATVQCLGAYTRHAPELGPEQTALISYAQQYPQNHLWFFTSSEAIQNLRTISTQNAWAQTQAVVTHPRIAQQAQGLGIEKIHLAKPHIQTVMACIQSLTSCP
jgi:uroporphyrinogen-III synthase